MTTNLRIFNSTRVFLKKAIQPWKDNIVKQQNGRCKISNQWRNVDVHHQSKSFHKIVDETFAATGLDFRPSVTDYTQAELALLATTILKLHEGVTGVLVARRLHEEYHKQYQTVSEVAWKEFKAKYKPRRKSLQKTA